MSLYLDTNVIYSLVFADAHSERADVWARRQVLPLIVGDWAKVEFCALVGRLSRGGALDAGAASVELADFERFVATQTRSLSLSPSAADALHLASAVDAGGVLVTLDQRLADAARARGHPVETP